MSDVTTHELTVVGVRVELPSNQPIVLLKEVDGDQCWRDRGFRWGQANWLQ